MRLIQNLLVIKGNTTQTNLPNYETDFEYSIMAPGIRRIEKTTWYFKNKIVVVRCNVEA